MQQTDLFATPRLPDGMIYQRDFITPEEERVLVAMIAAMPLKEAKYQQYTARRRTMNFGAGYDFSHQHTTPAAPIPSSLHWLRDRAASWAGLESTSIVQALIAEYRVGTPLGWHRDVPDYEVIVGISLAGVGRLRLRPYPWSPQHKRDIINVELEPRSAYILRGAARWKWQHQVPPTKTLRYSITFRSARSANVAHDVSRNMNG
jgi:alkylated DNA repair dioxygenase AlkB